jgi:hypothetical protein
MGYLRGFAPWIVAGVVSSFDWRWGALGGLVSGLLLMLQDRRRGVGLADHTDVISFGWLAATAWGTLVMGRPFTLGIAKRQTPREYWDMPEFIQVNNYITSAWGAGYAAEADASRPPTLIAALGPRMPEVARELADGNHPYLVTPAQTAQVRAALGPDKTVAVEMGAVLTSDRETALRPRTRTSCARADHVCVQVLMESPFDVPTEPWRELAPALVA